MTVAVDQTFEATGTTSDAILEVPVPDEVPVGAYLVLATNRSVLGSAANGVASISGAGGDNVWELNAAHASRAGAHDLSLHVLEVVDAIPAASTLTVTWTSVSTRKAAAGAVLTGLDAGGSDQSSGGTPGAGNVSTGDQGNSATSIADTAGAVADPWSLSVAAHSLAGTATAAYSGTEIATARTTVGSTDRGVGLQIAELDAAGDRTLGATYSASAGWAAGILTFPITGDPPVDEGPTLPAVLVDGDEVEPDSAAVYLGGVEVEPTSIGVWIDGTEVPL